MLNLAEGSTMTKKRYSETFKERAVHKVLQGATAKAVATETGASAHSIRDWVKAYERSQRERPATAAELTEIRSLKRKIRILEEEKLILKKATALYVRERE